MSFERLLGRLTIHDDRKRDLSPLDEFLEKILAWNPKWIYQQSTPDVVDDEKLMKTRLVYGTYQQYLKVALPLLIHECWFILKKGNEEEDNKNIIGKRAIGVRSINFAKPVDTNAKTMDFHTYARVSWNNRADSDAKMMGFHANVRVPSNNREDSDAKIMEFHANVRVPLNNLEDLEDDESDDEDNYPCRGDMVIISHPYRSVNDAFGYVMDLELTRSFNNEFKTMSYTVLTKKGAFTSDELRHVTLTTVTSILSHVLLVRVLVNLKESKLMETFLRQEIEALEMPQATESIDVEERLNTRQQEVVSRILKVVKSDKPRIALIQGPPGTGKSRVIVNVVAAMLKGGHKRILICAPSNKAVDELVLRLIDINNSPNFKQQSFDIVRLGRKKKMHKKVLKEVSLAALVRRRMNVSNRMRREIERSILKNANVIAATLSSSFNKKMEDVFGSYGINLPICIIDEAGQAKELETLIPLLVGVQKLILVGDPKQLPPTVLSQRAKHYGFDLSLFARAEKNFERHPRNPIVMLDTQYRMVESISQWPNKYFYNNQLKNEAKVPPLIPHLVNYKILNHSSSQSRNRFSNSGEAQLIVNIVEAIMTKLYSAQREIPLNIGIITPYKDQQALIHCRLKARLEKIPEEIKNQFPNIYPNTVDSFQGQERDIVIMSCVRSEGIGFCSDPNRLCVSLTRAKHSLIICGNFKTFEANSMWNSLLNDAKSRLSFMDVSHNLTCNDIKKLSIFTKSNEST